jgi:uncharacterized membrane protein
LSSFFLSREIYGFDRLFQFYLYGLVFSFIGFVAVFSWALRGRLISELNRKWLWKLRMWLPIGSLLIWPWVGVLNIYGFYNVPWYHDLLQWFKGVFP